MKFEQYYSSSKGNLYVVTANSGHRLLIECGVTWKKIQKALNYDLTNIDGCLLTHEHQDHAKGVKEGLAAGIDVYASCGTLTALDIENHCQAKAVHWEGAWWRRVSPDFRFAAYNIDHDAAEPLAFRVCCNNKHLLFVIDTNLVKYRFGVSFSIIALCCNYDNAILTQRVAAGEICGPVAKRLLTNHMEKQTTLRYLREFCNLSQLEQLHLLHLSGSNIDKAATQKEFADQFLVETVVI